LAHIAKVAVIANALNVSSADNESEEKDYQPHCFSIVPAGHISGAFPFYTIQPAP
jgi:hypothetical protein